MICVHFYSQASMPVSKNKPNFSWLYFYFEDEFLKWTTLYFADCYERKKVDDLMNCLNVVRILTGFFDAT